MKVELKLKDGGSAFPVPMIRNVSNDCIDVRSHGMTLRDYFAAAALQGAMSASRDTTWGKVASADAPAWAMAAYAFADAMLAERQK